MNSGLFVLIVIISALTLSEIVGILVLLPFFIILLFKIKKEAKKEETEKQLSLCTKLIVYTSYYFGSDSLDEETLCYLKDFISTRYNITVEEKLKCLKKMPKEINEYFKIASEKVIDQSDIMRLCDEIARLGTIKSSHLGNALFSAAFQTNEYNYLILQDIFDKLGFESWQFSNLYESYTRTRKKRKSNTTQNTKKSRSQNTTQKEEKKEKKTRSNNNQQNQKDTSFETLTLELLVEAMKVDRSKMVCELDVIKAFILKHDKDNFQKRVLEVKKYLSYEYIELHVEEICTKIYKQFRQDYQKREDILKILVELIYADETCTNVEYNFLKKVADMLKVSKTSFDFMRMKFENRKNKNKQQNNRQEDKQQSHSQSGSNQSNKNQNNSQPKYTSELEKAYAALGIDKDASDKEIRACWRNQIRVNHPDLMESKGAEAVMKATVKCQELNKAFEIVKASRGMK